MPRVIYFSIAVLLTTCIHARAQQQATCTDLKQAVALYGKAQVEQMARTMYAKKDIKKIKRACKV